MIKYIFVYIECIYCIHICIYIYVCIATLSWASLALADTVATLWKRLRFLLHLLTAAVSIRTVLLLCLEPTC